MERTPQIAVPLQRLTAISHSNQNGQYEEKIMKLFRYQWTNSDGSVMMLELYKENKKEADLEAKEFGWKPKKWWQWWRFNDYQPGEPK